MAEETRKGSGLDVVLAIWRKARTDNMPELLDS